MFRVLVFLLLASCAKAAQPIRGCYATNWARYRSGVGNFDLLRNYQPGICTHVFWAFATVNASDLNVYPTDAYDWQSYNQLRQLKQRQPGLKTLISIGGANFDSSTFATAAAQSQVFARNVISFIQRNGFDGIDLDWEYPTAQQRSAFTTLMRALRAQAGNRYLVTAAVSAGIPTAQSIYDFQALKNAVDFLNVMTYDYHGSWDEKTGLLSPLNSNDQLNVNATIQFYLRSGFPAQKIVLGVPTYGRGWTLQSNQLQGIGAPASGPSTAQAITQAPGILAYYEACQIVRNGAQNSWDAMGSAPYMQQNNQWFTYPNSNSVSFSAWFSKQMRLAGCFVWTIDFDDFSGSCGIKYPLLNTIATYLRN
ncbi:Cht7 [Aphelenchoides besseyi]|nr:Cht7 [Aphelenchoides besseyi]KAI6220508.1 Cht7 [Aphelenchoides besseyi]